jgi:ribonuclease HII
MPAPFIHDELILGIDEAGRGPVLGPMVMACVALRPRKAALLTRAGVTDSKSFAGDKAHESRLELLPRILELADHIAVMVVDVAEIDRRCRENGLNRLEQERAAFMISRAPVARRIVCDGERLFRPLQARWPHLEALDNGELQHASVAAASIVAKVRRDQLWQKICRRYAPEFGEELVAAGGGYANLHTRTFLRAYIKRYKRLPPEARRSWPWDFARDLLGKRFDPWWDVPDDRPQLGLFATDPPEPSTTCDSAAAAATEPTAAETPAPESSSPSPAPAALVAAAVRKRGRPPRARA